MVHCTAGRRKRRLASPSGKTHASRPRPPSFGQTAGCWSRNSGRCEAGAPDASRNLPVGRRQPIDNHPSACPRPVRRPVRRAVRRPATRSSCDGVFAVMAGRRRRPCERRATRPTRRQEGSFRLVFAADVSSCCPPRPIRQTRHRSGKSLLENARRGQKIKGPWKVAAGIRCQNWENAAAPHFPQFVGLCAVFLRKCSSPQRLTKISVPFSSELGGNSSKKKRPPLLPEARAAAFKKNLSPTATGCVAARRAGVGRATALATW